MIRDRDFANKDWLKPRESFTALEVSLFVIAWICLLGFGVCVMHVA